MAEYSPKCVFAEKRVKKATSKTKKGKMWKRCPETSYSTYVYKFLKQVQFNIGISLNVMRIVNYFLNDIFECVSDHVSLLVRSTKCSTVSSREIQTAVRLLLPGELGKYAVSEGTKALIRYISRG